MRHALVHNPGDILYGRLPRFRLSDVGRKQATRTGQFLSTRPISALYSSPLLRARQTAALILPSIDVEHVQYSRNLLEVRTAYQGSPNSILKPGFSFFEPRKAGTDESMEDVWRRMHRFLQRIATARPGKHLVAVCHADPITIMRVGLLGQPMTNDSLHSAVYPARASINQIVCCPNGMCSLTYFDVSGEETPV